MAQEKLGLSQAMPVRYVQWLGNVFTGDLGTSFSNGEPVTERISQAIVPTIKLIFGSAYHTVSISYVIGYLCGTIHEKVVSRNNSYCPSSYIITRILASNYFHLLLW